ncbi:MAG TPA: AraC family transcriptional regulator [Gemmatimonadaceae bacterium]|nr:AraC family transcriptional regulator [Gemmatimonadaceae bacterium]
MAAVHGAAPVRRPVPVTLGSPRFQSVELECCRVNLVDFPSTLRLAPHIHERPIVAVTLGGAFDISFRARTMSTQRGWVHVEPATERHGNAFVRHGARVLALEVNSEGARDLLEPCLRLLDTPLSASSPAAEVAAQRLAREIAEPDDLSPVAMEGLLLQLLAAAGRLYTVQIERARPPQWLLRARDMLHEGFAQSVRVRDVARAMDVHPMQLVRAFEAHFGVPPSTYLRRRRLEWATAQLAGTDEPLAAIAARAGYADQSHFTRDVRRGTGLTPLQYRRSKRR